MIPHHFLKTTLTQTLKLLIETKYYIDYSIYKIESGGG